MISEPELEGEEGRQGGQGGTPSLLAPRTNGTAPEPPGGSGSAADSGPGAETIAGDGIPTVPPHRIRWLWALGGAVVASAVWAGGLYAYDRTGPDLLGYRASSDLCLDADLPALSALLGNKRSPQPASDEQHAIDRSFCGVTLMRGRPREVKDDAIPTSYSSVTVNYTLHKKTDPGPEFDATLTPLALSLVVERKTKRIPDLGERAYLMTDSGGYTPQLTVLDGRAVFTIEVMSESVTDGQPGVDRPVKPVDPAVLEPAMVEDMKDLMAALRK